MRSTPLDCIFLIFRWFLSLVFTENITFQTTEKCGGQVQVNYGRNWKNVCVDKDTLKNSKLMNNLCKEMNCEYNTNARLEKVRFLSSFNFSLRGRHSESASSIHPCLQNLLVYHQLPSCHKWTKKRDKSFRIFN